MGPDDISVETDQGGFDSFTPEELAAMNAQANGQDFDPDNPELPGEAGDGDGSGGPGDGQDSLDATGQGDGTAGARQTARGAGDQETAEQRAEREEREREEGVETVRDQQGRTQKRVSFHKYQRTLTELEDIRNRYNQLESTSAQDRARIEERLAIINEALQTPQNQRGQQEEQQDEDPMPDPEVDIFAFAKWGQRQMARMQEEITTLRDGNRQQQETQELQTNYRDLSREFASQEPAFVGAYRHLMGQRQAELLVPHQRYGGADGRTPLPIDPKIRQQVQQKIAREEMGLVKKALEEGVNPAQRLFAMARARGFDPQAYVAAIQQQRSGAGGQQQPGTRHGQRQQPGQRQQQQPQDPNALDAPARGQQLQRRQTNGTGAVRQQPALDQRQRMDESGDLIDNINNGQRAAGSLSTMRGSGGAAGLALTPQDLATMGDDEFGELMDRLSESKLRELLGD